MKSIKPVAEVCVFSATVGIVDGLVAAGIAALVAGTSVATTAFAVVGGVSTVVAAGAFAMCKAAAEVDELSMC